MLQYGTIQFGHVAPLSSCRYGRGANPIRPCGSIMHLPTSSRLLHYLAKRSSIWLVVSDITSAQGCRAHQLGHQDKALPCTYYIDKPYTSILYSLQLSLVSLISSWNYLSHRSAHQPPPISKHYPFISCAMNGGVRKAREPNPRIT